MKSQDTASRLAAIDRMLNPHSVVVIGATERMQYGGKLFKRMLEYTDRLRLYAVNPRYDTVMGHPCFRKISDLPEAPELAIVVVPHHVVLDSLKECHARGVKACVIISAGFAEHGTPERRQLQDRIGAFARESGMRVSGPNCLGLANVRDGLWLTSSGRAGRGIAGAIGLVCQSGATLFGPLLARANDRGLGLSYAVSTGNEADLDFSDFARYLLDDPATQVIAGYMEGLRDGEKFLHLANYAAQRGKPIVLIKVGRSEQGARAAQSHTAALTGKDRLFDAICRQYGIVRVTSYDDLLDTAQLLADGAKIEPSGVAVVSHSGGVSSLTADLLGLSGFELPLLSASARAGINDVLGEFGAATNPADVTNHAHTSRFATILEHLGNEGHIDSLVVATAGSDEQAGQIIAERDRSGKLVAVLWTGSVTAEAGLPKLRAAHLPVFMSPEGLARAFRACADYRAWMRDAEADDGMSLPKLSNVQQEAVVTARRRGKHSLSETESKTLLESWSVPFARERLARSIEEVEAAAEEIGYPVVLKIVSPDIAHKTEAGGVHLDIRDAISLRNAYREINTNARLYAPTADIQGVLVGEMVSGGVETIAGLLVDEQFGPILMFGIGGITVELYDDVAFRRCPINVRQARDMINEVKGAGLLRGFRGAAPADASALAHTLCELSVVGAQLQDQIVELELNPLSVLADGRGVRALDAHITLSNR